MSKNLVTTDGKKREPSVSEWEEIELKPPIDKIADEFVRNTNQNVLVELVYSEDDTEAKNLKKFLRGLGFMVNKTDKDRSKLNNQIDGMWINKVHEKIEKQECDGLIMIFAKVDYKSEVMKNIWSQFTSNNCEKLKNKPKIFIFQIIKRAVTRDGTATTFHWAAAYETPAEADILIIHDRYDPDRTNILRTLKTGIQMYGAQENIFALVHLQYGKDLGKDYQPLVISTMTKQFFFKISTHRRHHLHLYDKNEEVLKLVKQIKKQLIPKKKESTFFKGLKKRLSFKKKRSDKKTKENGDEKLEVENKNENTEQTAEKIKEVKPIKSVIEIESTASTSKEATEDFNNQIIFSDPNSTKQMNFLEKESMRKLFGGHGNPFDANTILKNEAIIKEEKSVLNPESRSRS